MKKKIGIKIIVLLVIILVVLLGNLVVNKSKIEKEILTVSSLEKIINISDLNTYQAVYNGVAKVMNENNPDEIDCYVSYEAKVDAGFDFERIEIVNDIELKRIIVTIPKIEIKEVNVDIASLDYIYLNKKSTKSMITKRAYEACKVDVENESKDEIKIYALAEQNAKNIVEALLTPFIGHFEKDYELLIRGEVQ